MVNVSFSACLDLCFVCGVCAIWCEMVESKHKRNFVTTQCWCSQNSESKTVTVGQSRQRIGVWKKVGVGGGGFDCSLNVWSINYQGTSKQKETDRKPAFSWTLNSLVQKVNTWSKCVTICWYNIRFLDVDSIMYVSLSYRIPTMRMHV